MIASIVLGQAQHLNDKIVGFDSEEYIKLSRKAASQRTPEERQLLQEMNNKISEIKNAAEEDTSFDSLVGFFGKIPTIQFIQKINGIISMTGEKLHEKQFIEAVKQTQKDTGIDVRFFVGFADVENSVYDFYYEFADNDKPLDELQKQADEFSKIVDKINEK